MGWLLSKIHSFYSSQNVNRWDMQHAQKGLNSAQDLTNREHNENNIYRKG